MIRGDYLYGRGSFDDKGGIAVFATAAMRLARAHVPLKRDIVLVFEADEEGGDYGIEWLAENHWDKLDAAYSLNEGGIISTDARGPPETRRRDGARQDLASPWRCATRGVSIALFAAAAAERDRPARARAARISRHRSTPQLSPLTRRYFRALARASRRRRRPPTCGASRARTAAARSSGSAQPRRSAAARTAR